MIRTEEPLEMRSLVFVAILIRDTPLSDLAGRIALVIDCATQCAGEVLSFDNSIVLVTFGMIGRHDVPEIACDSFLKQMSATMGNDLSIVFGSRAALVGPVGTENRKSFTVLFEGYRALLTELVNTPLGSIKET